MMKEEETQLPTTAEDTASGQSNPTHGFAAVAEPGDNVSNHTGGPVGGDSTSGPNGGLSHPLEQVEQYNQQQLADSTKAGLGKRDSGDHSGGADSDLDPSKATKPKRMKPAKNPQNGFNFGIPVGGNIPDPSGNPSAVAGLNALTPNASVSTPDGLSGVHHGGPINGANVIDSHLIEQQQQQQQQQQQHALAQAHHNGGIPGVSKPRPVKKPDSGHKLTRDRYFPVEESVLRSLALQGVSEVEIREKYYNMGRSAEAIKVKMKSIRRELKGKNFQLSCGRDVHFENDTNGGKSVPGPIPEGEWIEFLERTRNLQAKRLSEQRATENRQAVETANAAVNNGGFMTSFPNAEDMMPISALGAILKMWDGTVFKQLPQMTQGDKFSQDSLDSVYTGMEQLRIIYETLKGPDDEMLFHD